MICYLDFDACASTPCQNSGNCVNQVNGYSCTCVAGYTGPMCQIGMFFNVFYSLQTLFTNIKISTNL